MHINLFGSADKAGNVNFDLPPVYFVDNQTVAVSGVFIKWKEIVKNQHGLLTSSLVDRSPINPQQQLLYIYQNEESNFTHIAPRHLARYKIQCPSLQSSVFNLHLSREVEIEKIYIQLTIDAGVQRIHKKTF